MQKGLRIQKLALIELHVSLLARDHDGRRLNGQPRGGAVQHGAELFRRHGLDEIVQGIDLIALSHALKMRRDKDDLRPAARAAQALGKVDAAHAGHFDVQQQDIPVGISGETERLRAREAGHGAGAVRPVRHVRLQPCGLSGVVVTDRDLPAHGYPPVLQESALPLCAAEHFRYSSEFSGSFKFSCAAAACSCSVSCSSAFSSYSFHGTSEVNIQNVRLCLLYNLGSFHHCLCIFPVYLDGDRTFCVADT